MEFQLLDYYESRSTIPVADEGKHDLRRNGDYFIRPRDLESGEFPEVPLSDRSHNISLFGRTEDGFSVCLNVKTFPLLVLRVPGLSKGKAAELVAKIVKDRKLTRGDVHWDWALRHDAGGFHPDLGSPEPKFRRFAFLFLAFRTQMQLWSVRSLLMRRNGKKGRDAPKYLPDPVAYGGVTVQVVEKMIPNVLQLLERCGITPSSWVAVDQGDLEFLGAGRRMSLADVEASVRVLPFGPSARIVPIPGR